MDANDMISRAEHEEFSRRIDDENNRQNARIDSIEAIIKKLEGLYSSIEKLASNMESMVKEQERQGKRLELLESRDGEMWRKTIGFVLSGVVGVFIGFISQKIGLK